MAHGLVHGGLRALRDALGFAGRPARRAKHPGGHHPGRLGADGRACAGGLASGESLWIFIYLLAVRFLFGAFQAGTFPSISRMMADWMPSTSAERPKGYSGCPAGSAARRRLASGLVDCRDGRLEAPAGPGGLSGDRLVRGLLALVPEPARRDAAVNQAELKIIASGRAPRPPRATARFPGRPWSGRGASWPCARCTDSSATAGTSS